MATKRKQPKVVRIPLDFGEKTASTARQIMHPVFRDYPRTMVVPTSDPATELYVAYDPEGGTIAYSVDTALAGVAIDDATGILTVTPQNNAGATSGNVTVTATSSTVDAKTTSVTTYVEVAAGPIV